MVAPAAAAGRDPSWIIGSAEELVRLLHLFGRAKDLERARLHWT